MFLASFPVSRYSFLALQHVCSFARVCTGPEKPGKLWDFI